MTTTTRKRTKDQRRDVVPSADVVDVVDVKDGAAMLALPTDRHRDFVRALYQVKPGHGSGVKAAKLAGFGTSSSSAQSMATIASRLLHDERVQQAIAEEDQKRIRGTAPRAISALQRLVEDPKHRDHARGIAMVLDRVHPATQVVKHEHDASPVLMATATVLARIHELARLAGIDPSRMPPLLEARAVSKSETAP